MTKSGISEGDVCVSCDAVFDIPAHGTFSENFSFSFSYWQFCKTNLNMTEREEHAVCVPRQVATKLFQRNDRLPRWTTMDHTLCCSETAEGIFYSQTWDVREVPVKHSTGDFGCMVD